MRVFERKVEERESVGGVIFYDGENACSTFIIRGIETCVVGLVVQSVATLVATLNKFPNWVKNVARVASAHTMIGVKISESALTVAASEAAVMATTRLDGLVVLTLHNIAYIGSGWATS